MKKLTLYSESFGCQMNVYDTDAIVSMLSSGGFDHIKNPADADVIIVNTCSVREHAETRAIGRLNELSRCSDAVLVVCGCMAQRLGDRLFELVPGVSIVAGTDSYKRLPATIAYIAERGGRASLLEIDGCTTYSMEEPGVGTSPSRYLSITRGCENYCSYCIVPYLRGRVRSKEPVTIVHEIRSMIDRGTREVTLLGQNVLAYNAGDVDFTGLLGRIMDETDIFRLRFLTSHPRDITDELFRFIARHEPRICPHIHLPVQSGSNRILELMNRGYSRDRYLGIVDRAREIVPGLALTTDIIVGFPSETEEEFSQTLDLVERARFDSAFTFKYSPREGTAAARMEDDIPTAVKKERLERLNDDVRRIRRNILEGQLGSQSEILLDGWVKKGEYLFWKGRTPHYRNVLIPGDQHENGDVVGVMLKEIRNFTFYGEELSRR
jgi:tRNA-2-methylthio-N6-dimethylallyladenosine synthase